MARSCFLQILVAFVSLGLTFASNSPAPAPARASDAPASDLRSPFGAPANPPIEFSPPAPSMIAPSDSTEYGSPVPSPGPGASDMASDINVGEGMKDGSSGMSGGKKAGVAFGVVFAVCGVGLGGFVYKRRQENMRKGRYSYAARNDLL